MWEQPKTVINNDNKNDNKKCDMPCASLVRILLLSLEFFVRCCFWCYKCHRFAARETDKILASTRINFIGIRGNFAETLVSRRRKSEEWTLMAYLTTCASKASSLKLSYNYANYSFCAAVFVAIRCLNKENKRWFWEEKYYEWRKAKRQSEIIWLNIGFNKLAPSSQSIGWKLD